MAREVEYDNTLVFNLAPKEEKTPGIPAAVRKYPTSSDVSAVHIPGGFDLDQSSRSSNSPSPSEQHSTADSSSDEYFDTCPTASGISAEPVPTYAAGSFLRQGSSLNVPPVVCDTYVDGYDNISVFHLAPKEEKSFGIPAAHDTITCLAGLKISDFTKEEAISEKQDDGNQGKSPACDPGSGSGSALMLSPPSEPTPPSYPSCSTSSEPTNAVRSAAADLSDITEENSSARYSSPLFHVDHGHQNNQDATPLKTVFQIPERPVFDAAEDSPSSFRANQKGTGTGTKPVGSTSLAADLCGPVRHSDDPKAALDAQSDAKPNSGPICVEPALAGGRVEPLVSFEGNDSIPAYSHPAHSVSKQLYRNDSMSSEPSEVGTISSMAVESGSNRDEHSDLESSPEFWRRHTEFSDADYQRSCISSSENPLDAALDLDQPTLSGTHEGAVRQVNLSPAHGTIRDAIADVVEKLLNKKEHVPDDREKDDVVVPKKLSTGAPHKSPKAMHPLHSHLLKHSAGRQLSAKDQYTHMFWTFYHGIKSRQRQVSKHPFSSQYQYSSPYWMEALRTFNRLKKDEQMKLLRPRNRKESAGSDGSWEPASSGASDSGAGKAFSFQPNPTLPFPAPEKKSSVSDLLAEVKSFSDLSLAGPKCRYEEYGSDTVDPQQYFASKKVSLNLPKGKSDPAPRFADFYPPPKMHQNLELYNIHKQLFHNDIEFLGHAPEVAAEKRKPVYSYPEPT